MFLADRALAQRWAVVEHFVLYTGQDYRQIIYIRQCFADGMRKGTAFTPPCKIKIISSTSYCFEYYLRIVCVSFERCLSIACVLFECCLSISTAVLLVYRSHPSAYCSMILLWFYYAIIMLLLCYYYDFIKFLYRLYTVFIMSVSKPHNTLTEGTQYALRWLTRTNL